VLIIEGLKYTKEHEWVDLQGDSARVGITDFAQHSLGDIVYVELPEIGKQTVAKQAFCSVESCKAASDIYSPVSGIVAEVNESLTDSPENLNSAPYESWLAVLTITREIPEGLMNADEYKQFCEQGE